MKCLVSGATGFIGRELCRQLLERGDTLIALSKSGAPLADGTPTQAVDLSLRMPAGELLEGVDVVFHLAGIAHQQAQVSAYRELNYLATLKLARQAAAAGVKRFVFMSSVKAMGPAPDSRQRSELDCSAPLDAYGRSKWQAECGLREEFASADMAVIILRPALVYGPQARGNLSLLARAVRAGLPRPPLAGGRSMIALPDLVELLCVTMASPAGTAPGTVQTWIACDGRCYTTRYIFDRMREALGKRPGVAWLPRWGWRLAAALMDRVAPTEATFDKLFGTELYSNARVLADTRWRPSNALDDAIPAMVTDTGSVR